MGCEGEGVHQSGSGWSPVFVEDNLSVMSAGFLLPSPGHFLTQVSKMCQRHYTLIDKTAAEKNQTFASDAAVIWRGPKKNGLLLLSPILANCKPNHNRYPHIYRNLHIYIIPHRPHKAIVA